MRYSRSISRPLAFGITFCLLLTGLRTTAQFWNSSSTLTTTVNNVGISYPTTPDAKLSIASGYSIMQSMNDECVIGGQPGIKLRWMPEEQAYTCFGGTTGTVPNIIEVFKINSYVMPPANPVQPILWLNSGGALGLRSFPEGNNSLTVGGASLLNGATRINGNTQVQQKFRINTSSTLNTLDWTNNNFPFTFSVDNGDSRFLGKVRVRMPAASGSSSNYLLSAITGANNIDAFHVQGNSLFDGPIHAAHNVSVNGTVTMANSLSVGSSVRIGPQAASGAFSNYRLSVDGPICAKRLVVQTSSWADDVFRPGYNLRSLGAVQSFIDEEGRLPDVPSEEQVKADGIDVGDMNAILLRKVEELTLYILKQQVEIDVLKKKTSHL